MVPAGPTSLSAGSRRRPSKPSADGPTAASKERQSSRGSVAEYLGPPNSQAPRWPPSRRPRSTAPVIQARSEAGVGADVDLWDDRRRSAETGRCFPEGVATPSDRPEFSSMADDYARHALSQRAAFEATHPAALAAARQFAEEPVLRVVDLGAADGVNSHGLIRALAEERAGRPLIYALVDLPTNAWGVAADHLRHAFGDRADGPRSSSSLRRAKPAGRSPMSAPGPTTPRRRPTARPAAARSSTARPRPR